MLFRSVAAGLLIVTSLVCATTARAEVMIVLPINLTGLDPGARFVQPKCYGFGADGRMGELARGALPFQPVTGGRFVQTVHIPLRRTEAAGGPVTESDPTVPPPAPTGPGSPVRTAGRTACEAHRRGGGRAEARSPLLARQRTRAYTPATAIEFPVE
jgi:hypothetical protein